MYQPPYQQQQPTQGYQPTSSVPGAYLSMVVFHLERRTLNLVDRNRHHRELIRNFILFSRRRTPLIRENFLNMN